MEEKYVNVDGLNLDDYDSDDYREMINSFARSSKQNPDPYGFYEREEQIREERDSERSEFKDFSDDFEF